VAELDEAFAMSLGRILPPKEMRTRAGISQATEWRLNKAGVGAPRIKLSGRRWGYPENFFEEWLKSRFERPIEAAILSATTTK
jgi:predicted DNA-binding transcriptional regulator AlpA